LLIEIDDLALVVADARRLAATVTLAPGSGAPFSFTRKVT